jgi:hypothetical protein
VSPDLGKLINAYADSKTDPTKKYDLYTLIVDFKDGRYPAKGGIDALLNSLAPQQQQQYAPVQQQAPQYPSVQQSQAQQYTPFQQQTQQNTPMQSFQALAPTAGSWNPLPASNNPTGSTPSTVVNTDGSWSF